MAPKIQTINRGKINITITTAGTAQPISNTRLLVTDFEVYAPSGNAGTNFYIGDSTVNNTWIPRVKGEYFNFTHGTGNMQGNGPVVEIDLSQIYIDVDNDGDAVIVEYFRRFTANS